MDTEACLNHLDSLFLHRKLADVEPFLLECVQQSLLENRPDATLTFLNELIGYYRSVSRYEDALVIGERAVNWVRDFGLENTLAHATTLINYATALRAGNEPQKALRYYDQALSILDNFPLDEIKYEKASLFNNMSMAYQAMDMDNHAVDAILTALTLIEKPSVEEAISLVNLAGCYYRLKKVEEGFKASQKAAGIFQSLNETEDYHYASALASLADGYGARGDYQNAARVNEQALQYQLDSFGVNDDYLALAEKQKMFLELSGRKIEIAGFLETIQPKKMNGLALSKAYYERYAKRGLHERFPEVIGQLAIGLVGMGSECLGLDDEISQDHDFGPGFCIFIPQQLAPAYQDKLQQFYDSLPKRFMGYERLVTKEGQNRVGVIVLEDFFRQLTGYPYGPQKLTDWLGIEDCWLLTAGNGEIFADESGLFTSIHQHIAHYYPHDVYLKKLSKTLAKMAQTGQYQYGRCMCRHDQNSALLYIYQFIEASMQCLFLMNHSYMPYTKWQFVMAERLPLGQTILNKIKELMKITSVDVQVYQDNQTVQLADPRVQLIEAIAEEVTDWLLAEGLSDSQETYLEAQAYMVKDKIENEYLRNLHVLEG